PRRHRRRAARLVGHANRSAPPDWSDRYGVGLSSRARAGVMRRQGGIAGLPCPRFVAAFLFVSLAFAGSARAQDTHVLVIACVSGGEEHAAQFDKWAARLVDAARKDAPPTADIGYLADKPERDSKRITGRSTRENVEKAFADLAARVRPNDEVVVILVGHG